MLKLYGVTARAYYASAAAARRRGFPFGGHLQAVEALEASDSGARIFDHLWGGMGGRTVKRPDDSGGLSALCWFQIGEDDIPHLTGSVEQCAPAAARLRRNNTWVVPTLVAFDRHIERMPELQRSRPIMDRLYDQTHAFWTGALLHGNWLRNTPSPNTAAPGALAVVQQVGLPILAGTDATSSLRHPTPGLALHAELAMLVAEGLTPLNALQAATINPAKMLHGTDSLGTVAPGKLADLVLLDADPLADITNTTTIQAVVANGRYFDRAALDGVLAKVQAGERSARDSVLRRSAKNVTAADVARRVGVLTADSMLDRDTPSPGLELTARYLAARFENFRLVPAGKQGGWFQRYPLPHDSTRTAPNVVGILEGEDPKLKHEYLVFMAHMDHLGLRRGQADSIDGVDDNALGMAGLLELANAFRVWRMRPRRSLIFLAVSGAERGLWGSRHFTARPPVPLEQMVAVINLDMTGRHRPDTIVVVGKGHSDLGATLDRVVAAHPELRMPAIDDPLLQERFYARSAHYPLARRGLPSLWFFDGRRDDDLQVSDAPAKVDAEKAARLLQLVFYLGQEVANTTARPQWDADSYDAIVRQAP